MKYVNSFLNHFRRKPKEDPKIIIPLPKEKLYKEMTPEEEYQFNIENNRYKQQGSESDINNLKEFFKDYNLKIPCYHEGKLSNDIFPVLVKIPMDIRKKNLTNWKKIKEECDICPKTEIVLGNDNDKILTNRKLIRIYRNHTDYRFEIRTYHDEWYILSIIKVGGMSLSRLFYLCDSLDGVKQALLRCLRSRPISD